MHHNGGMEKSDLLALLSRDAQARRYRSGELIVRQGDPAGEGLGFLLSGCARVYQSLGERKVAVGAIEPGQFFGETALVLSRPRVASVEALGDDTVVLFQSPAQFRQSVAGNQPFLELLVRQTVARVESVLSALARLDLRQPIAVDPSLDPMMAENRQHNLKLQDLVNHARTAWIGGDNPVFRQGERNDGQVYMVAKGVVDACRETEDGPVLLFRLQPGELFGYSRPAVLPHRKYTARAGGDSARIISFDPELLERLLRMDHDCFYYFFRSVVCQMVVLDDALRIRGSAVECDEGEAIAQGIRDDISALDAGPAVPPPEGGDAPAEAAGAVPPPAAPAGDGQPALPPPV